MSVVRPITDRKAYDRWVRSRPKKVRETLASHPPDRLYCMTDTKHKYKVTIYSYCEDGTVTVNVTGEYQRVLFERNVFGVNPATLVECDEPGPDEPRGCQLDEAGFTREQQIQFVRGLGSKGGPQ